MLGRRRFLDGVFNEHCHYVFGKAAKDDTYAEKEARGVGMAALFASLVDERAADAEKLRAVMEGS
jgi:hypothetical protein